MRVHLIALSTPWLGALIDLLQNISTRALSAKGMSAEIHELVVDNLVLKTYLTVKEVLLETLSHPGDVLGMSDPYVQVWLRFAVARSL